MIRVTEAQFQAQVIQLAKLMGWLPYHTHDSRRSHKGFPDLVLAKAGRRVIFAELKSETGQTRPEQDEWLDVLKRCDAEVYLWRPSDLEKIAKILGG